MKCLGSSINSTKSNASGSEKNKTMMREGKGYLYLIPCATHPDCPEHLLPKKTLEAFEALTVFVVENIRSARRYIRKVFPKKEITSIVFFSLDPRDAHTGNEWISHCLQGMDVGLISEAGSPSIADPGYKVVAQAHAHGIRVTPLVGPCFITLALSSSGLYGQNFRFWGYLPVEKSSLKQAVQAMEESSGKWHQTQIFIETPYRNQRLWEVLLASTRPETRIAICTHLTLDDGFSSCKTSGAWKKEPMPEFHKKPTVFLIQTK